MDPSVDPQHFLSKSTHTNNWAVIVDTSRWWHNYRHAANALSMYRTVKRLGIPDSHIILMLADDMACNPRNTFKGQVFSSADHAINIYGEDVEVDYRDYEVTVEEFIRLIVGRHSPETPGSKRLLTDSRSNVFFYLTGHGGVDFLKFQDAGDVNSKDIGDAFAQMWMQSRYNEILFVVDTCQAATLYSAFHSPNIIAIGSSAEGENSYSHNSDPVLGNALLDRFTFHSLQFFEQLSPESDATIHQWFSSLTFDKLMSNAQWRDDLFPRDIRSVRVTDFLGANPKIQSLDGLTRSSTLDWLDARGGHPPPIAEGATVRLSQPMHNPPARDTTTFVTSLNALQTEVYAILGQLYAATPPTEPASFHYAPVAAVAACFALSILLKL